MLFRSVVPPLVAVKVSPYVPTAVVAATIMEVDVPVVGLRDIPVTAGAIVQAGEPVKVVVYAVAFVYEVP